MATFGGRDYRDEPQQQQNLPLPPVPGQPPAPPAVTGPSVAFGGGSGGSGGMGTTVPTTVPSYPPGPPAGSDVPRGEPPSEYREPRGGGYQPPYDDRFRGDRGQPPTGYGGGRDRDERGGGRGGEGYDRDPNFMPLGFLYGPNRKGSYSVFLKRDMIEILRSLEEDDLIGISEGRRGGYSIWARRIDPRDKDEYRRGGGRGRGQGRGRSRERY